MKEIPGRVVVNMILNDIAPEFPSYEKAKEHHMWRTGAMRLHRFLTMLQESGVDVSDSLIAKFAETERGVFQPYI